MTKLPIISSKEVIKALIKAGFEYAPKRGKGSHIAMIKTEGAYHIPNINASKLDNVQRY